MSLLDVEPTKKGDPSGTPFLFCCSGFDHLEAT